MPQMKRLLFILLLVITVLYVFWILFLDIYYFRFICATLKGLSYIFHGMLCYCMEDQSEYMIQLTNQLKYNSTQALEAISLPFVILLGWHVSLFFHVRFKRALIMLCINILIYYILQIAFLMTAPFANSSGIAKQFNNLLLPNFSILVIFLIIKDVIRLKLFVDR
jgi:hypothetical protein